MPSRDPIGYVDGASLYAGYFGAWFALDPTGTIVSGSGDFERDAAIWGGRRNRSKTDPFAKCHNQKRAHEDWDKAYKRDHNKLKTLEKKLHKAVIDFKNKYGDDCDGCDSDKREADKANIANMVVALLQANVNLSNVRVHANNVTKAYTDCLMGVVNSQARRSAILTGVIYTLKTIEYIDMAIGVVTCTAGAKILLKEGVKAAMKKNAWKGIKELFKKNADDWAELSGKLKEALKKKGNFGMGSATREQAEAMGKAWVGDGYKVASDGKTLISKDGLRQYRPPSYKPRLGRTQANFERKFEGQTSRGWQSNGHVDITD